MAKRIQSPSSINTFKQCKRKYYYQYIEKLPVVANIHQIRGNIAHDTLEQFFDVDVSSFTTENYPQKFQSTIQALLFHNWRAAQEKLEIMRLNKDQERFYFEETMLMIMNWATQFIDDVTNFMQKKNISLQEAFLQLTPIREEEYQSQQYSVRGFIDAIKRVEDEIHIIDYKTNNNFEFKDSIKLQLAIYSLLYYEKHAQMPSKVGIFFLRHKLKLINADEELLALAKQEIALIHAHTAATENIADYPRTINGLCKWSTGQCDFYDVCKPHALGK